MKIYIWRNKKLAHDLRDEIVTEKEQMFYLLLASTISALFLTSVVGTSLWSENQLSIYDYAYDIIYITLTLITIVFGYKINANGNNKKFIERHICLLLPIIIKTTFISVLLITPAFIVDLILQTSSDLTAKNINMLDGSNESSYKWEKAIEENISSTQTGIATFISLVLTSLYTLWLYTSSFKIASGQKDN